MIANKINLSNDVYLTWLCCLWWKRAQVAKLSHPVDQRTESFWCSAWVSLVKFTSQAWRTREINEIQQTSKIQDLTRCKSYLGNMSTQPFKEKLNRVIEHRKHLNRGATERHKPWSMPGFFHIYTLISAITKLYISFYSYNPNKRKKLNGTQYRRKL